METWEVSFAWGQLNSLPKRFALGYWGRRKLRMVPCHSCYIYGTWRSKEVGKLGELYIFIWRASHKVTSNFYVWELPPLESMILLVFCLVF